MLACEAEWLQNQELQIMAAMLGTPLKGKTKQQNNKPAAAKG